MTFAGSSLSRLCLLSSLVSGALVLGVESSLGASPPVRNAKALTCPDGPNGVTDGPWTVVCSGTLSAGVTVKLSVASSGDVLKVAASAASTPGATISYSDVSFLSTGGSASLVVSQGGLSNKLVGIAVTKAVGGVNPSVDGVEASVSTPVANSAKLTWKA
jgi:hypothetical protein